MPCSLDFFGLKFCSVLKTELRHVQLHQPKFSVCPLGKLWFIPVSGPSQSVAYCSLLAFLMNCSFLCLYELFLLCASGLHWEEYYVHTGWEKPARFSCSCLPTEVISFKKVVLSDLAFLLLFCNCPLLGCFNSTEQRNRAMHSIH